MQTFFANPASAESLRQGRVTVLPLPYSRAQRYLESRHDVDLAFLHLSRPDAQGKCSLGLAAEFTPTAMRIAARLIGVVNTNMPFLRGAPTVDMADLEAVVEDDSPPLTLSAARRSVVAIAIGKLVAALIPDGATIQLGIGTIPATLYGALSAHKGLAVHSGLITDGLLTLGAAGALSDSRPQIAGALVGERSLYEQAPEIPNLIVAGVEHTHDVARMAQIPSFVSINSALEVDLFGQVNVEAADGRLVSGIGGALDFIRGAQASPGGISIIALSATARAGSISRIVPQLGTRSAISIARADIDHVVTEFGSVSLRGLGIDERAEALIQIAAPTFRGALAQAWSGMR
jgi:4-hydroxybutyrate CoA-transferase